MECPVPECKQRQPTELGRKLKRLRPWVQTGFLAVWLAPVGQWLHGIPGCVFHCYSCPLSSFACQKTSHQHRSGNGVFDLQHETSALQRAIESPPVRGPICSCGLRFPRSPARSVSWPITPH